MFARAALKAGSSTTPSAYFSAPSTATSVPLSGQKSSSPRQHATPKRRSLRSLFRPLRKPSIFSGRVQPDKHDPDRRHYMISFVPPVEVTVR
jgi:hypothetical protein